MLAQAQADYPLSTPHPGWAEQDPDDWWRASRVGAGAVGRGVAGGRDAGAAAGIGLSGQMHGLVALDAGDCVLRPAILWNDQRTAAECREIEHTVGLERLIALTGNRALTGFTAPKLLWLRRHEPEVYANVARIMLPKDYVRLRLCGEHATDVADASGTLLLDVGARRWSEEVLSALELEPAWLPRVLESPAVSGLTSEGVPVAAGCRRPGGGRARRRGRPARAAVGRAGDLGSGVRGARAVRRRPAGARSRFLSRGARMRGTRWA